jgi:NitT/TauT family transport system permease protein
MMRIRQPIRRSLHLILGVVSIFMLVAGYTALSSTRQIARKERARVDLERVQKQAHELESKIAEEKASGSIANPIALAAKERELVRLKGSLEQRERDVTQIEDRTVPTWSALYRDGLLRALRPEGLKRDEYWLRDDCWATGLRLGGGLLVSVVLSVLIGLAMGCYEPIEAILVPPLSFLAKIPPTAMLAVFFVLVGTTYRMYISMIVFGTLPTLAQSIYQAAKKDVPDELVDKAYTLGASQFELIWNVVYQQILPRLIDAVRLQVGPAMVLLIAAEYAVASVGIGYRLRLFYNRTDMTVVFVYLILLGIAGLIIDYLLIWLRRRLCPWFGN